MTQHKAAAKTRGSKKPSPAAELDHAPAVMIVPSAPEPIALRRLRRAPENVRHVRVDEDVDAFADDIAAHGLLSSLIGYAATWPEDGDRVFIVGGGRRLQALQLLRDRGLLDDAFPVPVLIRDAEMAVELSLAENLQQRTMSPVDEFHAFKALIDTGRHSVAELARRFGFSERLVKQRLRLADLAAPVLDALAAREITIDAAMAYASTQDQERQAKVFASHAKNSSAAWGHQPRHIRGDLARNTIDTADPLFKFVGAASYESRGGEYEDELFSEATGERMLLTPTILMRAAQEMADFQAIGLVTTLRDDSAWSPSIDGHVLIPGLRLQSWGTSERPKAPAGFVLVERWNSDEVWRTIRNNNIPARIAVGVNTDGVLVAWPRYVFVPEAQKQAVDPSVPLETRTPETEEQRRARERADEVAIFARRLAVGPFAGTHFEGRAFWPDSWQGRHTKVALGGVPGWFIPVNIFVTDADVAAQAAAAEAEYEAHLVADAERERLAAERAEEQRARLDARADELATMDPPAVAVIDGEAWFRADDGSYAPDDGEDGFVHDWAELLANYGADDVDSTYANREDFDAAMAAARPAPANDAAAHELAEAAE